jgi:hypothetical protein
VVCNVPLGIRQSGLFLENGLDLGAFRQDFDGIGLLGDKIRAATGGVGEKEALSSYEGARRPGLAYTNLFMTKNTPHTPPAC